MTWGDYDGIIINTPTLVEFNQLMDHFKKIGANSHPQSIFDRYKEETCIRISKDGDTFHGTTPFYIHEGCTIITVKEYLPETNLNLKLIMAIKGATDGSHL